MSRPYKSGSFVGAARMTSRPCCSIYRGGWSLDSRARHCRGGSITSRPYKKFIPLLQTVFYVVPLWMQSPVDPVPFLVPLAGAATARPWASTSARPGTA